MDAATLDLIERLERERDALQALLVASTTTCQDCGTTMPKTSNHKRCSGCSKAHRTAYNRESDRMAATIRHNRARGKHQVEGMSDIVLALKRRNWSDEKIGRELGMDSDEVLRLAQITGLAEAFKDRAFSLAWEAELALAEDDDLQEAEAS